MKPSGNGTGDAIEARQMLQCVTRLFVLVVVPFADLAEHRGILYAEYGLGSDGQPRHGRQFGSRGTCRDRLSP